MSCKNHKMEHTGKIRYAGNQRFEIMKCFSCGVTQNRRLDKEKTIVAVDPESNPTHWSKKWRKN